MDMTFGNLIRKEREKLGMSARSLASKLSITPAYLSDIENGHRAAPKKHLDNLIEVLQIKNRNQFYELTGSPDLHEYIDENPTARIAIRRIIDEGLDWDELLDHKTWNLS